MASAKPQAGDYRPAPGADEFLPRSIWRAPLVPAALALTAGILLDRRAAVPLLFSLLAAAACLIAWLCTSLGGRQRLALAYLALAGAAFGAAYHRFRHELAPDDIAHLATEQPRPVQVRGVLDEEPFYLPAPPQDPLRSLDRREQTTSVLRLDSLYRRQTWTPIGGKVRLMVQGALPGLHAGDEIEAVGQLSLPQSPGNPGEFDYAANLRDQGIGSVLVVRKTAEGVTRLSRGWHTSAQGWLVMLRGWGQEALSRYLPPSTRGVGIALLLGEGAPMTQDDWDKYLRTGVIHVLAISGQHLVVLAAFFWLLLPRLGVRQRQAAVIVGLSLFVYALLTGGRPPALRSAVAVAAACAALVLQRRTLPANLFALAWLVVALVNPADLFTAGCLLSFLSVAVLAWGMGSAAARDPTPPDPLDQLIEHSRPAWQRLLRGVVRKVGEAYLITALVWLAVTPLAASRFHVVPLVGLLLGPPLVLLTAIALLCGFVLLACAALCPPLASLMAVPVHGCLALCEKLVDAGMHLPGGQWYVGDIPEWWLWIFYLGLLAVLTQPALRRHWTRAVPAALGWLCLGLLSGAARLPDGELRCTFLAVGHGGCTVIETSHGRTLLYDAGALGGPDVARRVIAPYLWTRGTRRIDEVFISHGDLDHFNGLIGLLDRFAVGQVSTTPTFARKDTAGVAQTLEVLQTRGIPLRVLKSGDVLTAGELQLQVLHPPAIGPEGNENARSLVLAVHHAGHTILLTGDLEGTGQDRVLSLPPPRTYILMAPHHGSPAANGPGLAHWAQPRVVISCQGAERGRSDGGDAYRALGTRYLSTWAHGAVTIHSHSTGLVVETFRTAERFVVRSAGP